MNRIRKRLIDSLESSGSEFVHQLQKMSKEDLVAPPAPNEWSPHQIAAHVRDVEQHVFLNRTKRILGEVLPTVQNFNQDTWHQEHYSSEEAIMKIISDFRAARRKQIALLRKTKDKDWSRCALHSTYGRISLEWLTMHSYHHTLEHVAQIGYARETKLLEQMNR